MIINGEGIAVGRLATFAAKHLINGEKIHIVNAEKVIITGNPETIVKKYMERRKRGSPHHGPFFPSKPADIVRRAIRGMLPYKTKKGRAAYKSLRVYESIPEKFKSKQIETIEKREINSRFITIGDLSKAIKG